MWPPDRYPADACVRYRLCPKHPCRFHSTAASMRLTANACRLRRASPASLLPIPGRSPSAAALKTFCCAKTYAYGPHGGGSDEDGAKVEEGGDWDFIPDVRVKDGDILECDGFTIECVFTPGHTSNHMCFALKEEKALF